jgi:phenylacetate-CoA ligase
MAVSASSVTRFAGQWRKVKPTLIFGHAHSIFVLAQVLQQMEIQDLRPKGIISSSMMLLPHERRKIEEVFGTKVTDRYGCEEVGLIASECERHKGMHLNIEHLLIEFVRDDGASAAPGEPGRIVVTDLLNRAMPLIRYQVEDVGVPGRGTCPCGRGLPLMDRVVGRTADFLIRRDGTRIAGVSLIENTLTKLDGIDQMQIVQEDLQHIVLNLVPGSLYDEGHERALREYFAQLFLNETQVEIRVLTQIEPEPSGKYRFSICKLKA